MTKADTIARGDGDDFAVILEMWLRRRGLILWRSVLSMKLASRMTSCPKGMQVTASVGVAMYPDRTRDDNQLRVFADRAMYAAKKDICNYSPDMQ
ncbi:MAG: GGDEF domain-containing protein [Cellvibrionales bacterium]|nr:GGDEF domain-containing protein [Cellvibrionales bacterium]